LEMTAKLLILLKRLLNVSSKCALKSLNNPADFDSAIRRFDPSRPSQASDDITDKVSATVNIVSAFARADGNDLGISGGVRVAFLWVSHSALSCFRPKTRPGTVFAPTFRK